MIKDFNGEMEFCGKEGYILCYPDLVSFEEKTRLEKVIKEAFGYHITKYMNLDITKNEYKDAFYIEIDINRHESKVRFKLRNIPIEERLHIANAEIVNTSYCNTNKLNLKQRLRILWSGRL